MNQTFQSKQGCDNSQRVQSRSHGWASFRASVSQRMIIEGGPSLPSSHLVKLMWPGGKYNAFFESMSASIFSPLKMWEEVKWWNCWVTSRVLSFQLARSATWKSACPFNQSIISLESPSSRSSLMCKRLARTHDAHAAKSSAFVLDPVPQFSVHR